MPIPKHALSNTVAAALFGGVLWAADGAPGWNIPENESIDRLRLALAFALYGLLVAAFARGRDLWAARRPEILLAFFSTLLSLLALEIALRTITPESAPPRLSGIPSRTLHHIYAPHTRYAAGEFEGVETVVATNEDGLRTPYSRAEFLDHEERIVVAGDSFVFGLGVQDDQAAPQQLESLLRDRRPDRELAVLNAGVVSYSPLLVESLYHRVLKHYRPTRLVLCLDASDVGDDLRYLRESRETTHGREYRVPDARPPAPDRGPVFNQIVRPYLVEPLRTPWDVLRGRPPYAPRAYDYYEFRLDVGGVVETNRYFIYRHPLETTRPYFDFTFAAVDRLAKAIAADGAVFTLVVLPRYHHWSDRESPNNWEARDYRTDEPHQFEYFRYFDEQSETAEFQIVNLLPAFQSTDRFPLTFDRDAHFNQEGHRFLAELLASIVD